MERKSTSAVAHRRGTSIECPATPHVIDSISRRCTLLFAVVVGLLSFSQAANADAPTATAVTITGIPDSGQTLTGTYIYNDVDGDLEGTSTFRWLRDGSPVALETAISYLLTNADQGTTIVFEVTPVAATALPGEFIGTPVQSSGTGVTANVVPTATSVIITGIPVSGQTLTGDYVFGDVDGDLEGTSTFRWLRDGSPVALETAITYQLTNADQGTTIVFEVTPEAATGATPGVAAQSPGAAITPNAVPTATSVSITGIPVSGQTLTGDYVFGDVDGDLEGTSTFRWLRDGSPVALETANTYQLTNADQGTTIVFEVTPVAVTGATPGVAVPSAGTPVIGNAPPNATLVTVTGVPESGQTLTGDYVFGDVDGDLEGTSTFRWLRDGSPVALETAITYQLTNADQGTTIVFEVTPEAATGATPGNAVQSSGTLIVANAPPTAAAVSITGAIEVGFILTGNYTYDDIDADLEGISIFRWLRDGVEIPGAVDPTYLLDVADEATTIIFEVTPVAQTGTSPGIAVASLGVGPILPANTAPTATFVSIAGNPQINEILTGSYTYDDADGDPEGISTFAWLRDGTPISGATNTSYVVVIDDVETTIQFEVTPLAQTGVTPGIAVPSPGVLISNTVPSITGQLLVSTPEETGLEILLAHLTITDPDSVFPDDFTLSVQDGVNYVRVDNTITPILDFVGDLAIPVTVNDGASDSAVFLLTATVTAVNDQPVIVGPAVLTTLEDTPLTVLIADLTVLDPDNLFPDDFTFALLAGANYTLLGDIVTPDPNFNGDLTVPVTVTDNSGELNATSNIFAMTITVDSVNDDPVVESPIGNQVAIEETAVSLNVSGNFSDADNDTLTFVATGLPASGNLSFDSQTGVLSGTPRLEDARDNDPYIITVTATDGNPSSIPAVDVFDLNISALDRANVSLDISVAPDPAMLNDELQWTITISNLVGPQAAVDVQLAGSFVGSGLTVSSANNCTIQAAVGEITDFDCPLGGLPVGGSTSIVLSSLTSAAGDVVAFATAAGASRLPIDPILEDNSSQVAVGVAEAFSNGAVQVLGSTNVLSVAAGDLNNDGAVDLVVGTAAGQPVQIYLSEGFRDFAATPIPLADTAANEGVALADFDGNGTVDLVVANGGGQADIVYSNDGAGNFTPMVQLPGATFSQDVAVGDFDSDGFADVVFATIQGNPVYLGNGLGGFSLHQTLGSANSHAVAAGEFDNNSRDDIVFANEGSDSQIWTKNAGNGFSTGATLAIGDAMAVTVGDFGGNAQSDLAFGRTPTIIGDVPANPVLINDGTGGFGAPQVLLGTSPTFDILAGDVNSDSLTDLVFINASGVHQIWLATGSGFDLHREQIVDQDSIAGVLTELGLTDTGNPGGVDLAMGGAVVAGLGVFLNDGFGNLGRGDAVIPVLILLGEAALDIPSGTAYIDAGATASDNIDGDISASIVVVNSVNTSVVGSYTITYNVSDFAGNAATQVSRTVNVTPAAGTGGGGGGALTYFTLLFMLIVFMAAKRHRVSRDLVTIHSSRSAKEDI